MLAGRLISPSARALAWLAVGYSHSDPLSHRPQWAALWDDLDGWLQDKHKLPVLVAGDYNSELHANPQASRWLTSGYMNDVLAIHEGERCATHKGGQGLGCTCTMDAPSHWHSTQTGW